MEKLSEMNVFFIYTFNHAVRVNYPKMKKGKKKKRERERNRDGQKINK